jgi:DNA-binding response OmpR family regulator
LLALWSFGIYSGAMNILIVEDERKIAEFIARGLEEESFGTAIAESGEEGLEKANRSSFDIILLDIMLPGIDGIELCKKLRNQGNMTPIIMLTARDAVSDKVSALDFGADDYITKPFAFEELLARIRVLHRKASGAVQTQLRIDDLSLDLVSHTATRGGKDIQLSNREYCLLEYLMTNAGNVVSRMMIAEHVWGIDFDTFTNTIDVYINYIRNKIDSGSEKKLIHTIRGKGYCLGEKVP